MKPETRFRRNTVAPFLNKLPNTAVFPIQQVAISGDPDYILCVRGHFVALELKDEGEVPRKLQQYKLDLVVSANGIAISADKSNWPGVADFLSRLAKGDVFNDHA